MLTIIIGIAVLALSFAWTIDAAEYIIRKNYPNVSNEFLNKGSEGILGLMLTIFLLLFIFADYSNPETAWDGLGKFLLFWIISVSIINIIRKFDKSNNT